ncbi:hypothetical protein D3C77_374200 [compost metagenome]
MVHADGTQAYFQEGLEERCDEGSRIFYRTGNVLQTDTDQRPHEQDDQRQYESIEEGHQHGETLTIEEIQPDGQTLEGFVFLPQLGSQSTDYNGADDADPHGHYAKDTLKQVVIFRVLVRREQIRGHLNIDESLELAEID